MPFRHAEGFEGRIAEAVLENDVSTVRAWLADGNDPDAIVAWHEARDASHPLTLSALTLITVGRIYDSKDAADYGMLRMLLAHGADPNFEYAGTPMIHLATRLSKYRLVELLLEYDVRLEPESDNEPNVFTGALDDVEMVALLARHGAHEKVPTVMVSCIRFDKREALAVLIAAGCSPNDPLAPTNDPFSDVDLTPLVYTVAQEERRTAIIRMLLRAGARLDAHSLNDEGREAARQLGHAENLRLLADVEEAGGWKRYVRAPCVDLLILRILCERGRARPPRGPLKRLFSTSFANSGAKRRARGASLPDSLFWHVLSFWRSQRQVGRE